ncbi:hypothetical protein CHUAL_011075 [Chamberlinius hualienensis]
MAACGLRCNSRFIMNYLKCYSFHRRKISVQSCVCSQWFSLPSSSVNKYAHTNNLYQVPVCLYSSQRRTSFLGQFIENIKQEMAKDKEMKESLTKFREEAEKIEKSDALKKAREKYEALESETSKSSQVIKEKLEELKDKLQETLEEAQKSDIGKKATQISSDISKSAREAAESVSEKAEALGKSAPFKAISEGVKVVKQEIDDSTLANAGVYKAPEKLRKRVERLSSDLSKVVEPNTEATGVELHKESRWAQSWQNFKDNNPYVTKVFHWKMKYDESDNPVIRASRLLTDKVTDIFGGLFQKTELSEVLTEICKMDPTFNKEEFLKECEAEIIPNILEALVRGDLEILKDWCNEAPYNALATPIKQAQTMGYVLNSKILDITNVDLSLGKMMEQGPVLVISFQSQQIMVVKNSKGEIVEGDADKVIRVFYVWALCRDQNEVNPKAAWKLMDMSANTSTQWL